jgi:hypothetical protein
VPPRWLRDADVLAYSGCLEDNKTFVRRWLDDDGHSPVSYYNVRTVSTAFSVSLR